MIKKMKKCFKPIIAILCLCVSALSFTACNSNSYIDYTKSPQTFSSNAFQSGFIVSDNLLLMERETKLAVAQDKDGSLTLKNSFNFDEFPTPDNWVAGGNFAFAFYTGNSSSVRIKIYGSDFRNDIEPMGTLTTHGAKLVQVQLQGDELYLVYLLELGDILSAELTQSNGNPIAAQQEYTNKLDKYDKSGYCIYKFDLSKNDITYSKAYLYGVNPKYCHITSDGIIALFRKKADYSYLMKYSATDFSLLKQQKIEMTAFSDLYQDGDHIVITSDETYIKKDTTTYSYKISVFNADLNLLDYKKVDGDKLSKTIFYKGVYVVYASSDFYYNFKTVYTFSDNKLTAIDNISYGDINTTQQRFSISLDKSTSTLIVRDTLLDKTISQGALPIDSATLYQMTIESNIYNSDTGILYLKITTSSLALAEHEGIYVMNAFNSAMTFVKKISLSVDPNLTDFDIGVIEFERISYANGKFYLVYNAFAIEYNASFTSFRAIDFRKIVSVHFDANGGEPVNSIKMEAGGKITSEQIRKIIPVREGYTFVKWVKADNDKLYNLQQDVTLTALWEVNDND